METIKVNMTPNPSDIQTIHCSQGDTDAREWEFELHNNGEVIDAGGITEQMVFKSYKGGTEQILPENGAVPVTAPFVGDIKYPDATRNGQEFLYRKSPTEKDGNAKIKNLYGKTLVWNQLVQNGNFSAISPWAINSGGTLAVANNEGSITLTSAPSNVYSPNLRQAIDSGFVINHKYLFSFDVYLPHQSYMRVEFGGGGFGETTGYQISANTWHRVLIVRTRETAPTSKILVLYPPYATGVWSENDVWKIRNVNVFDLNQMGLDISNPSEFTSLFSKPYYDYCKGAMLSFGGRNVKFNQLVQNGNFVNTNGWNFNNPSSVSVSSNTLTVSANADASMGFPLSRSMASTQGHKYLIMCDVQCSQANQVRVRYPFVSTAKSISANTWTRFTEIGTATEGQTLVGIQENGINGATYNYKNFVCFDLTEMFGAGNEPSAEGFKELFSNDYYEYNIGQYMNLGQPVILKTVGKNQVANVVGGYFNAQSSTITVNNGGESFVFYAWKGKTYYASSSIALNRNVIAQCDTPNLVNGSPIYNPVNFGNSTETKWTATWTGWTVWYVYNASSADVENSAQVEIGASASSYESYKEDILSIPLDEFPNGMDGVNDARDEKSETGYAKRIGQITFDGTQSYVEAYLINTQCRVLYSVPNIMPITTASSVVDNGIMSNYLTPSSNEQTWNGNAGIHRRVNGATQIMVSLGTASGITSVEAWNAYLSAHPLTIYYPLNVPLENYGVVDLGSLNWNYNSSSAYFTTNDISSLYKVPSSNLTVANIIDSIHTTISANDLVSAGKLGIAIRSNGTLMVKDTNYTDANAFKQAMSGVYLLYEKENSEGFTTATLVTENGEVALANENGILVGKCNSDVSADAGFIEGKIKLSDEDGDVYSNKIQIHVERSPQ